jgi:hypothetical protein
MAQAWEHSIVSSCLRTVSFLRWSGLPGYFAPCPPPFGLLLYLRKLPRQTAPGQLVFVRQSQISFFAATGWVCLSQRSKGGAKRHMPFGGGHERGQMHPACCGLSKIRYSKNII